MVDPATGAALIAPLTIRAGEKLATKASESLVDEGVSKMIESVRNNLETKKQRNIWDEELGRTGTIFNEELQKALSKVAEEVDNDILREVSNEWEDIAVKLGDVEIAYKPKQAVVGHICGIINNRYGDEHSIELHSEKIQQGVETAYSLTLQKFADKVTGTELADRLEQHFQRDLMQEVNDLREGLEFIGRYVGHYEPYSRLDIDDEGFLEHLVEHLSVENRSAVLERGIPFENPDSFESITDISSQYVLIGGSKGVGKTRTLVEAVGQMQEKHNFGYCIVITEPINDVGEVENLTRGHFDEDILLIWDDIQKSGGGTIVRDSIQRLIDAFDKKESRLFIRATVRKEQLDTVLPKSWNLDDLKKQPDPGSATAIWRKFNPVGLSTFDKSQLRKHIQLVVDYHELSVDNRTIQSFTDKAYETDPTPFYIDSICQTAEHYLTESEIHNIPNDALSAWENAYSNLPESGEYNDAKKLLYSLLVLEKLGAERPFNEWVVEDLFLDVFNGNQFRKNLQFLQARGWLTRRYKNANQADSIVVHDIRLEAIDFNISDREIIRRGSPLREFLLSDIVEDYNNDLGAVMNSRFAQLVFGEEIGRRPTKTAKKHISYATKIANEPEHIQKTFLNKIEEDLIEYLGDCTDVSLQSVSKIQIADGINNSVLNETTKMYKNLRLSQVEIIRISKTSVEISASARYKPSGNEENNVDHWGYSETDFQHILTLHELDPMEADLMEIFIPSVIKRGGGFANFREVATKTTTLVDRVCSIYVPEVEEVQDRIKELNDIKSYIGEMRLKEIKD